MEEWCVHFSSHIHPGRTISIHLKYVYILTRFEANSVAEIRTTGAHGRLTVQDAQIWPIVQRSSDEARHDLVEEIDRGENPKDAGDGVLGLGTDSTRLQDTEKR